MKNFFYSLISLIIALFFIMIGIIGIMIPWSDVTRSSLIQFLNEDALAISLFGFAFIVIGSAIVVNILLSTRRRYYLIRANDTSIAVDESIIEQYLAAYWGQLFPGKDIPCRLSLKDNKIHIAVDLPYMPISEQKKLLEKIKEDLRNTFADYLGYRDEFNVSVSFQSASKYIE